MRKLVEATFVSLDGVVESPEKWASPYFEDENKKDALSALSEVDLFLLGRVSYEKFSARWPQIKGDPYLDKINSLPKLVASSTLRQASWNATLIKGDLAQEISNLKAQPGKNIMKYGTTGLDRILLTHNLVDELRLFIFPVIVGSGGRLLQGFDAAELKLTLVSTKKYQNGVVSLTYIPKWTGPPF